MLTAFRLISLLITPLIFWGAWYFFPDLLTSQWLQWLSGIATVLWGLELFFLERLSSVTAVEGLSSREHQRLVLRAAVIRRRIWWIGSVALVCAVLIWVMASMSLPVSSPLYAALVGVLFGINLSYLILIPAWLNESQAFMDEVKRSELEQKKREALAKRLGGSE